MDLDATLERLARDHASPVDAADLALHLARDEYPDLDIPSYLARINRLAADLRPRLAGSLADRVDELATFLFAEHGYRGNADDYYDARNSYLNDVLDRKLGIPITLSILAAAVGTRAGLNVVGVGLPGHFVAKATLAGEDLLFDPFHGGRPLTPREAESLVRQVTGDPFDLTPDSFAATPPGLIAVRMLNNLKGIYLKDGDFPRAARVIPRLCVLAPNDPLQRRDLGVTLAQAGRAGKAIDPLEAYLAAVPDAPDREAVEAFLKQARDEIARWN
jgi:regulator of sirC expression with transglutaminase-like and TPR domain